jgi:hypothetical protein
MKLKEQVLGVNWRTTMAGLAETALAVIAAISILPEETWQDRRKLAIAIGLIVLKTIRDVVTKDAAVSGIGTLDDPHRRPDKAGRSRLLER